MLQLWHKTSVLISASQHQSNPSAVRMNAGNFYSMLALLFSLDLYCQLFQSLRRSRVLPNPQPWSNGEGLPLRTLPFQGSACSVKVTERQCALSYKITWQTQELQINYGFLFSATVDQKMDTSQEQENVPWPIRFCFGLTVILFKAYFLVLFTLAPVPLFTHEIFQGEPGAWQHRPQNHWSSSAGSISTVSYTTAACSSVKVLW